jgi:hypothetical protein
MAVLLSMIRKRLKLQKQSAMGFHLRVSATNIRRRIENGGPRIPL